MRKMKSKLFFQISIIILPIFALITAAVLIVVYFSSINSFLEAQNDYMRNAINTTYQNLKTDDPQDYVLFLSYIEQHPSVIEEPMTDEEMLLYTEAADSPGSIQEKIKKSEELYKAWAKLELQFIINNFKGEYSVLGLSNYSKAFVIDVSQEHMGLFICKYDKDSNGYDKDSFNEFDPSAHPQVKELIESASDELLYEKTEDFPDEGNYYICYKPIIIGGKTLALLGVAFNWDDLRSTVLGNLTRVFLMIIGGLLFALILLQFILYRKAIQPIRKIQNVVQDYTDDKDSGKVVSKMSQIKVNNELGMLSDDISKLAKEIDFYTTENVRLASEKERVAAELDMATKIQADQLPSKFPDSKEFDIYASMTPAKEVGGDFYDLFFVDDDHLALVIADVSGKGVPAALFMMMSKNLIRNLTAMGLSPKEVIERANQTICDNNKQRMFVTVWLGILEISTGKVTAVNAGHEIPFVKQPGGEFELFEDPHGLMVGAFKTAKYQQYEFALQKGGTLFVYTDGVAEATNADDEMFGTDRLKQALDIDTNASPKHLLENVRSDVDAFVGDAEQFDDLTMLGITLH